MTIEALERQLERHKYSPKTIKAYSHCLKRLSEFHNQKPLSSLTPSEISQFFKNLERRYSRESIRQAAVAIRYYYRKIDDLPHNRESIPSVKLVRLSSYIPSRIEILHVASFLEEDIFRTLFLLIYGCGLELSDALSLRISNVNLEHSQLNFKTQRGKERTVQIPEALIEEIKHLLVKQKNKNSNLLTYKSTAISRTKASRTWVEAKTSAGSNAKIDIRSLRHAYVMDLVSHGHLLQDVLQSMSLSRSLTLTYYSVLIPFSRVIQSPLDFTEENGAETHLSPYVSEQRIKQIQKIVNTKFDFSKLLGIISELNKNAKQANHYSIALLLRTTIDHIAPVFGQHTFAGVANNYPATKSLRKNLQQLDVNLRNIADLFLHDQISCVEVTPTHTQVDFRQQLDQLLAEMVRALTRAST